jgi:hypothetical protein
VSSWWPLGRAGGSGPFSGDRGLKVGAWGASNAESTCTMGRSVAVIWDRHWAPSDRHRGIPAVWDLTS